MRNLLSVGGALLSMAVPGIGSAASDGDLPPSAELAKPLGVGAMAPDASLFGLDGVATSLSEVITGKPTVLIFYRGGWCPFCNRHLADLSTIEEQLRSRGYQIVAITPDLPSELKKTMVKDHLTYKLYSDAASEAMKRFGVAYQVDDKTMAQLKGYNINLEAASGNDRHILPVPSVFIVDKTGKIVFVHANPNYKVRMKAEDVLKAADGK